MQLKLVAFDLDDTLAPSKSSLPGEVGKCLRRLLDRAQVLVISGGNLEQFQTQLLSNLFASEEQMSRLHLMPTCGTRYYRRENGIWQAQYAHDLDETTKRDAITTLEKCAKELGLWEDNPAGDIIEDRGSQITYSALGQQAPLEAKRAWDPTGEKKARLRDAVAVQLPDLEVRSGGSTSVDVTMKGVDKAYGMAKIMEQTGLAIDQIVFVGDRLDPQGNDYPVKKAGFETISVSGWQDTVGVIGSLIETRLT